MKPVLAVIALAVAFTPVRGQEFPKLTPARKKLADEWTQAAIDAGTLEKDGEALKVKDRDKLREFVKARQEKFDAATLDALIAGRITDGTAALLEEVGTLRKDVRVRGFAALAFAFVHNERKQWKECVERLREAAKLFGEAKEHGWQGFALSRLGNLAFNDDPAAARKLFKEALAVWEKSHPDGTPEMARCMQSLGLTHAYAQEYAEALAVFRDVLKMRKKVYAPDKFPKGHPELAEIYNGLGTMLSGMGRYGEAVDAYKGELGVLEKLYPADGFPRGLKELAFCHQVLSVNYKILGDHAPALKHARESLDLTRKAFPEKSYPAGHPQVIDALTAVASIYQAQEDYDRALDYRLQTLAMARQVYPATRHPKGHPALARSLNDLGVLLNQRGESARSANYLRQALKIKMDLDDRSGFGLQSLSNTLGNLGQVLVAQGEPGQALPYQRQSLAILEKLYPPERFPDGHRSLAIGLGNLGYTLRQNGDPKAALEHNQKALAQWKKLYPAGRFPQGHPDLAISYFNNGFGYELLGDLEPAAQHLRDSLRASRLTGAEIDFSDGRAAARALRPTRSVLSAATVLADCELKRLKPESPVTRMRACEQDYVLAMELQERLRRKESAGQEDKLDQGEKFARLLPGYVTLLGLLYVKENKASDLETIFAALEAGRARVFLERLGQAGAARLAGLPAKELARETQARQAVARLDARVAEAAARPGGVPAALIASRREADDALADLERQFGKDYPRYAGLRHPKPCSIQEARDSLADDEVALLYLLGHDLTTVLVIDKKPDPKDSWGGLRLFALKGGELGAGRRHRLLDIGGLRLFALKGGELAVADLVAALSDPDLLARRARADSVGRKAYEVLVKPLEERIKGKNLVIVPDGVLNLVPFEALVDGDDKYLVETRRVRYAPSMTALHLLSAWEKGRENKPDRPLFAVGDPVFSEQDERLTGRQAVPEVSRRLFAALTREGTALDRLKASGDEVRTLGRLLKAGDGDVLIGAKATESAVKSASASGELARRRHVHFATHGILGTDQGMPPALVLSLVGATGKEDDTGRDDGFLTLPEVSALKLNADLVVLSACQTGKGRLSAGEGVSGLARAFLHAGTRGVVCSLWSVDDEATSLLMQELYRGIQKGLAPAESLRAAKRKMIADGSAPFFWAAFVHVGR